MKHLYRRLRRWLGFGCRAKPWKDAALAFCCERSRNHVWNHHATTDNGMIEWDGESPWHMPPIAPFVNHPREKEFDLVMIKGPLPASSWNVHCIRAHTEEEHPDCPIRAIEKVNNG